MLIGVILSFLPILKLNALSQIPQRVDSRAQKELFENLEKLKKNEEDRKKLENDNLKKGDMKSDPNLNLNHLNMNPNTVSELINNQQNNNAVGENLVEEEKKIDNQDVPKKKSKLKRKGDPN